jgi:hypothetical protein
MPVDYLHNRKDFPDLIRILGEETGIVAGLIEKDYWMMHVLNGLRKQGFDFELKGGTSLSKGYKMIHRFSEDIDIHIKPPDKFGINESPKNNRSKNIEARKKFYDWLAETIKVEGIDFVERDTVFDDTAYYRSGGIRLYYKSKTEQIGGIKEGILLEAGFDTVTPNFRQTISSWAFDKAIRNLSIEIIDNRAVDVSCYHPGYTLVEKLQSVITKFRQEQADGIERPNFMRQYYDIYCLLGNEEVQEFMCTKEYEIHKKARFPKQDLIIPVKESEAFLLTDARLRAFFRKRYENTKALYYNGQPDFEELLMKIKMNLEKL